MFALIKWARQYPPIQTHDRTLLLERVFLEQYELSSGSPQRRPQEDSGVVKNPHDPDAQWAEKDQQKQKQWVGYKVHVDSAYVSAEELAALKANCTRALNGRRALVVGEHHNVLQQRRKEMKTDEFAKRMQRRNGIEGTISELVRGGARRTRYRGLVKTALANYFHAAAVNAKRWIRLEAAKRRREDGPEGQKRRRTPIWAVIRTLGSRVWSPWRENRDVRACAA